MGSNTVYKIVMTLQIMYWPMYLNEYVKIPVLKIYIKAYQYAFVKIMLDYICISMISTSPMWLLRL